MGSGGIIHTYTLMSAPFSLCALFLLHCCTQCVAELLYGMNAASLSPHKTSLGERWEAAYCTVRPYICSHWSQLWSGVWLRSDNAPGYLVPQRSLWIVESSRWSQQSMLPLVDGLSGCASCL